MNKNPFRFMPQISCQIQSDKICVFLKKDLPKKKKKHAAEITRAASWQRHKKRLRQGPQMQNEIECAGSKCVKGREWVNVNVYVEVCRSVGGLKF